MTFFKLLFILFIIYLKNTKSVTEAKWKSVQIINSSYLLGGGLLLIIQDMKRRFFNLKSYLTPNLDGFNLCAVC